MERRLPLYGERHDPVTEMTVMFGVDYELGLSGGTFIAQELRGGREVAYVQLNPDMSTLLTLFYDGVCFRDANNPAIVRDSPFPGAAARTYDVIVAQLSTLVPCPRPLHVT